MAHDVFISHATEDKAVANATVAALESNKISCWIAPRDILGGTEFAPAIVNAIRQSRAIVLVLSDYSNHSQYVAKELERAVAQGIPIIPFRIEDVPPSESMELFIASSQWLDAFPAWDQHLGRLADTVVRLLCPSRAGAGESKFAEMSSSGLCPICGHTNAPGRTFCSKCGEPLIEPCLMCGNVNGPTDKFCGHCGVDLLATRTARLEQLAAERTLVEHLRSNRCHADAIQKVQHVAALEHPRFREFARWAQQLLPILLTELQELERARDTLFAEAQASLAERNYAAAVALVEQVPASLRGQDHRELLETARKLADEVEALRSELRQMIDGGRFSKMATRVQRLLDLAPSTEPVRELLEPWFEHVFQNAIMSVAQGEFGSAVKILERVPEPLRNQNISSLLDAARTVETELQALAEKIEATQQAGDHIALVNHLQRYLQLRPKYEPARKLAQQFLDSLAETATAHLARCEHDAASKLLLQIPEPLRTDSIRLLINSAQVQSARIESETAPIPPIE